VRRRLPLALLAAALPLLAGCVERSLGETLYRQHCAACHGLDGSGNTPRYMGNNWANLLDGSWKSGAGDEFSIQAVVREGVFGQMPANDSLTDDEVQAIVDWVFYLRGESR
jgi:cytochrome c oxidase cbb3-type subunit 3